jgi:hypothetical protein
MVRRRRVLVVAGMALFAVTVAAHGPTSADDGAATFESATIDVAALAPVRRAALEHATRWRAVEIDADQLLAELAGPSVELELFSDRTVTFATGRFGVGAGGGPTWSATADSSTVTLSFGPSGVFGGFSVDGDRFTITPVGDRVHLVVEEGPADGVLAAPRIVPTDDGDPSAPAPTVVGDQVAAASVGASIIKVFTVYSDDAANDLTTGGKDVEAEIAATIDEANAALVNSGTNVQLESVGIEPVAYDGLGNIPLSLAELTDPSDGQLDGVHARRDEVDADLVALVVGPSLTFVCGQAWLLTMPLTPLDDEFGFSVSDTQCFRAQYAYLHEIGHNLGANHGDGDVGAFPYSRGYRDATHGFRTIMAYGGGCICPRIPYFSTPDVQYDDEGTLRPVGSADEDNARTIDETAPIVANFRGLPQAPRSVEGTAGDTAVTLTWMPPLLDGGSAITSYRVTATPGGRICTTSGALTCTVTGLSNATGYRFSVTATTARGTGPASALSAVYRPRPPAMRPLLPARLLETRTGPGNTTVDGDFDQTGPRPAGSVLQLQVGGRGGVPKGAAAAMLNVTAVGPDRAGHITVYPCDQDQPNASNLNYVPGQVVPNGVLAKLDPDGRVCIFTHASMDLLVDVNAYVPAGSDLGTLVPARLLETRTGPGNTTVDGEYQAFGKVGPNWAAFLVVRHRGGVPSGAQLAILNVTVVSPESAGHITVYPCAEPRPNASNLNYTPGQVVANSVVAKLDPQGLVCVYSLGKTDVLVDVAAYL